MQARFLAKRVEILENTVSGLEGLPARVEAVEQQILQHREETRAAFSAIKTGDVEFREEMRAFRSHVEKEFVQVRIEIREGDEVTRRQMRVLHEDVIGRFGVVGEGHAETQRQVGELAKRFDTLEGRFDTLELRVDTLGKRFDGLEGRFDELGDRLTAAIAGRRAPRRKKH